MKSDRTWQLTQAAAVRILLVGALALGGCQTSAQRTLTRATTESNKAMADAGACVTAVREKPQHANMVKRLPLNRPSLEMLANKQSITPQERAEYLSYDEEISHCRDLVLQASANYSPGMNGAIQSSQSMFAKTRLKLVQGQITWGQYYQEIADDQAEHHKLVQTADQQFKGALEAQHNQEIEQRARVAATIQGNAQRQQMINAINRPVNTSCTRFGDQVNCTSY